jgi:FkbM family methyltransferase
MIAALWREYVRFLRTSKERVGAPERWIRAQLLMVSYNIMVSWLRIRARLWGPLTVDGVTEDGIRLRCRLPDFIPMYVYLFGTWEPDLAAFLRHRLRPADTFIDIGANIGCVSALASKLVGPQGVVVAIEPYAGAIATLQETVAINKLSNIRVVSSAVSDHHHELTLFAGPSHSTGLAATVSRTGHREGGPVPAAPLGSLVSRQELATARIVKIDVEGAEDRVLAGMLTCVDAIAPDTELVVELSPIWWSDPKLRPIDVLRPFLASGFHVYLLPNDYSPWRYLWTRDIGAPQRLRDLAILERRFERLDVVLSRTDADDL